MPSKSEIKKNPKPSKKAAAAKKAEIETKSLKSKSSLKKIGRANGKVAVSGKERKITSRRTSESLHPEVILTAHIVPTVEQISARAHQMWLDEGCPEGRAQIHWQQAERELAGL